MKKFYSLISILVICFAQSTVSSAQSTPQWTRDINTLPDTASVLFPVKSLADFNDDVLVLSTFSNTVITGSTINKIYLTKYNSSGSLLWTYVYDTALPRGYDMVLDGAGNCYIAGGLMSPFAGQPLLLKVTAAGVFGWAQTSTTSFSQGTYEQLILKNSMLYAASGSGIAKYDLNGNEQWSNTYVVSRMAVDNAGQVIFINYSGSSTNLFRIDANGNLNFSDSTFYATRIAVDADNSFYLLASNYPTYELVKYDSTGMQQWSYNQFPQPPPFGDIGMELLVDYNQDLVVVGVSDTIYKFSPTGSVQWIKPMNGLDNYLIAATVSYNNLLSVAGTTSGFGSGNMGVALFDVNGNRSWSGTYDGVVNGTEFTVDMTINSGDIYVIENNNQNTTLVKFENPVLTTAIDYNLVCVDSVWYDANNPQLINVTLFNGNLSHLNYPSVQIVSPTGDTISNPFNFVNFFAHIGNMYQTYTDTIAVAGITDFSNYTFLVSEGFGDTTALINWCNITSVSSVHQNQFNVYPNPVNTVLYIQTIDGAHSYQATIYNCIGEKIAIQNSTNESLNTIDVSSLSKGIYFLLLVTERGVVTKKFVKE